MKTLILYYSYGGNTKKVAEMIHHEILSDIAEIETVKPYIGDYNSVVNQAQKEVHIGFMPEIKPLTVDITSYDSIILGTPVWWYTFAPAVKTFLSGSNLAGKVIYPFATNAGWLGHTFQDFEKVCTSATVKEGMNIKFNKNRLITPETEIKSWINSIR